MTTPTTTSGAAAGASARTSLIPETLAGLDQDPELLALHAAVAAGGQAALTREEQRRRQRSLDALGVPAFQEVLQVRLAAGACALGAKL